MKGTPQSHSDILSMSDDEFIESAFSSGSTAEKEPEVEEPVTEEEPTETEVTDEVVEEESTEEESSDESEDSSEDTEKDPMAPAAKPVEDKEPEATKDVETKPGVKPTAEIDYASAGKQLLAPFVANGKTIELNSVDEARQLMQMGANYTKKMQAIAPHRKVLLMLEKNELLSEDKLSYLIDLDKKNPEAIKKLIKESGIDPLDIDTNAETTYQEGNHRVTDSEAAFSEVLEDLQSTPSGQKTIQTIHANWDQASKEVLWNQPEIMKVMQEQRDLGIYDVISAEIDRRKTIGLLPPNAPFLQSYKLVGDEMAQAAIEQQAKPNLAIKQPVGTTVQKPKATVTNGARVSAASPSRATPRKSEPFINPLAMSDEDFLKSFSVKL